MNKAAVLALALFAALSASSCSKKQPAAELPLMGRLETFSYDPAARFEDRIGAMPEKLLEQYRLMDGRPGYKSYVPTAGERALLLEYLRLMPPAAERVFRESCVGLYFLEGFQGNGMVSWVLDEKGKLYFHMTLNPAAFRQTLSETLTERESSCFIPGAGWAVSVDAGDKYRGLAYALFHEAAHAVDQMRGVTPLVDPSQPEASRVPARPDGGLFTEVWDSYSRPFPLSEFWNRDNLTFYGFGGGPKIKMLDAYGVYKGFSSAPFASLYGSKSWAEDFAELTAYGLITGKLGQPYKIMLSGPGPKNDVFEPMRGAAARRSAAALALLEKM